MDEIKKDDFEDITFKYTESNWLEFKQSINSCPIEKIIETICGFLNTEGGYIIIGIEDTGKLIGIKSKNKDIDKFKLSLDNNISNNTIIYQNDEIILEKYLSIDDIINKEKKRFILIKIFPEKDKSYKLMNGTIIYRLNASNRIIKTTKLIKESDYLSNIETNQQNIIKKYNKIIEELNKSNKEFIKKEKIYKDKIILLNKLLDDSNDELLKFIKYLNPCPQQNMMK